MALKNIGVDTSGSETTPTKAQDWRKNISANLQNRKAAGLSSFTIALAKFDEQTVSSPALAFEYITSTGSNVAFSDKIKEQLQQMKTQRYVVANAQVSYPGGMQNMLVDPSKQLS